jgi:MoaA/NifB/PqqE/SkfB family radical SAM enzyme
MVSQDTPTELIYFVTNRCNFRCNHCFNKGLGAGKEDLTLSELERVLQSLKGARVYTLSISGGEPFLRNDLPEIISLFSKYCGTFMFMIPTNGYMTDRIVSMVQKISEQNPKAAFRVNISLDGLAEQHDETRGVKGSFEAAVRTIKALQALNLKNLDSSAVCCTVTRHNLETMADFQEYMNEQDVEGGYNIVRTNTHIPSPFVNKHTPDDPAIIPDEVEFEKIIKEIFAAKKNKSLFRTIEDRSHLQTLLLGNRFLHGRDISFECPAGKSIGVIYHNGDVAICENYTCLGNLRDNDYDFVRVWRSAEADRQRNQVSKCHCSHPCFINPALMKRWWRLLW